MEPGVGGVSLWSLLLLLKDAGVGSGGRLRQCWVVIH